jgi:hypothetical protein
MTRKYQIVVLERWLMSDPPSHDEEVAPDGMENNQKWRFLEIAWKKAHLQTISLRLVEQAEKPGEDICQTVQDSNMTLPKYSSRALFPKLLSRL